MTLFLIAALSSLAAAADLLEVTYGAAGRGVDELSLLPGTEADEARALVDHEDWDAAADAWRKVASDDDRSARARAHAYVWAAAAHVREGHHAEAQADLLASMVHQPFEPRSLLVAGWLLTEVGAGKEANKLLRRFPDQHPDLTGAQLVRMRGWTMVGKEKKALKVRRAAEEAGTTDAWFWLEAGMEAAFRGDPEALVLMERSTRTEGAAVLHNRVYLRLLYEVGMDEVLGEVLLSAANRYGDDPELIEAIMWFLDQPEGAHRLAAVLPDEGLPTFLSQIFGTFFWEQSEPDNAARFLAHAGADPEASPGVFRLWARSVDSTEGPGAATDVLLGAVERHPSHDLLSAALADAALRSRDPERLEKAANRLEQRIPLRLALAAHEAAITEGDGRGALRWARRAGEVGLPSWDTRRLEARALAILGRGNEALTAYEDGLRAAPDDPALLEEFAWFLLTPPVGLEPQPERARALAEQALEQGASDDSQVMGVLAEACWQTGDLARAVELQQDAVNLDPSNAELTRRLHRYEQARR